jgi:hypothetical protein
VPYDEFARLRLQAPVAWFPDQGSGFWSVHRYADIVAASRDVATFSSGRGDQRVGQGAGVASPLSVLIAAVRVFAIGWIVSTFVTRLLTAGGDQVATAVGSIAALRAASGMGDDEVAAVDVGTLPFDPRVEVRRQDGS